MEGRRKEERDADSPRAIVRRWRVGGDIHAERFEYASALPHWLEDRPVAVLRHTHIRIPQPRVPRRRNIERAGAIAAGSARVEHIVERPR
jgi:ferric-dicitrate binding protein FerR (iron transport regulator)